MCYVDDTFILVKNPFDVSRILKIMINIDAHIQLTVKES